MVAVRMEDLGRALGKLDDESRTLLELSMRRGMEDDEIAAALPVETSEVEQRRRELMGRLAEELGLDSREARDELYATLQDLPPEFWHGGS